MYTPRSLTLCDYLLTWTHNQIKGDRRGRDNVVNGPTLTLTHTQTQKMKEQQIGVQISEDFNQPMGQPPFN